jgi:predicted Zn finger-like uncharacterized protein
MKITCQSCDAKYSIADEKVQGKVAKIRCKKCGATIVVGGADAGSAPSAAAAESAGGSTYTVNISDSEQRSMSLAELVEAHNNGTINGDTYVWADGMDDWLPLASVPEITAALGGAPVAGEASHAPEPEPAPAAARREAGRSKVDLFGGASRDGSEEDGGRVSPPPAAPSSYSGNSGGGGLTGSRGEQSVLFSLNALAGAAASAPSGSSSSGKKTSEDSGLIDLSAMAKAAAEQPAAATAASGMGMGMGMGIGMSPMLGAPVLETPGGTSATAAPPPPQKSSKTGILIAGALFIGCGAIAAAVIFTRPTESPAAVAGGGTTASAQTATATATTTATATPSATSTAVDPGAPAASATTTATAAPHTGGKAVVPGPLPKKAATADPPAAKTAAPAKKDPPKASGSPCGCAPSDLMCNMKCSASKKK